MAITRNFVALSSVVYCNLAWDDLNILLIWVDKKNLIKFLFDFLHYIYNYYCGYTLYLL